MKYNCVLIMFLLFSLACVSMKMEKAPIENYSASYKLILALEKNGKTDSALWWAKKTLMGLEEQIKLYEEKEEKCLKFSKRKDLCLQETVFLQDLKEWKKKVEDFMNKYNKG